MLVFAIVSVAVGGFTSCRGGEIRRGCGGEGGGTAEVIGGIGTAVFVVPVVSMFGAIVKLLVVSAFVFDIGGGVSPGALIVEETPLACPS